METKEFIAELHKLIMVGQLEKTVGILISELKLMGFQEKENEVILLSCQLFRLEQDLRLALIHYNEATIGRNKIVSALLSILKELQSTKFTHDRKEIENLLGQNLDTTLKGIQRDFLKIPDLPKTGKLWIELTIDEDFETYNEIKQKELETYMLKFLGDGAKIKFSNKEPGSVKLKYYLKRKDAELLHWLGSIGVFRTFKVVKSKIYAEVDSIDIVYKTDKNWISLIPVFQFPFAIVGATLVLHSIIIYLQVGDIKLSWLNYTPLSLVIVSTLISVIAIIGTIIWLWNIQVHYKAREQVLVNHMISNRIEMASENTEEQDEIIERLAFKLDSDLGPKISECFFSVANIKSKADNIIHEEIDHLSQLLENLKEDVRSFSLSLYAKIELKEGLFKNVESLIGQFEASPSMPNFSFIYPENPKIKPPFHIKFAILQVIRKSVVNAVKYSNPEHITIKINISDQNSGVSIVIIDDGVGFDKSTINENVEFKEIATIAKKINGDLQIESTSKGETKVELFIQLN